MNIYVLLLVILCGYCSWGVMCSPTPSNTTSIVKKPILFVPGLFGSILESYISSDVPNVPLLCSKGKWQRQWAHVLHVINLPCFTYNMKLTTTPLGYSQFPSGVTVRNPSDNEYATACLEPSNSITCGATKYLGPIFDHLKDRGYVMGDTLAVEPYDFRLSPLNHALPGGLFERIKHRVEGQYRTSGQRVTLVSHSMGGALTALFLNTYVNQTWKDQHIARYFSVAAVYGGATKALKALLSGETDEVPLPSAAVKDAFNTWAGLAAMSPHATGPGSWNETIVARVGAKEYRARDIAQLVRDFGLHDLSPHVDMIRRLDYNSAPHVEVHCIIGRGFHTPSSVEYDSIDDIFPTVRVGDGDGTVPLRSLKVCGEWSKHQRHAVTERIFASEHTDIIRDNVALWDYLYHTVNGA